MGIWVLGTFGDEPRGKHKKNKMKALTPNVGEQALKAYKTSLK